MKRYFGLIIFFTPYIISAQGDGKKKAVDGFLVRMHFVQTAYTQTNRDHFQSYVKNNVLLDRSVAGFTMNEGVRTRNTSPHFALNLYTNLSNNEKGPGLEFSTGIDFGTSVVASAYYNRNTYDTTGIFINPSKNDSLLVVNEYGDNYYYQVESRQLAIPIGLNITSNKNRRLWISAGLELSPGIIFASVFSANYTKTTTELLLKPNSALTSYGNYGSHSLSDIQTVNSKVKGAGFIAYATVPLSINLRASKKIDHLKQLNIAVSAAPGLYYTNNRFAGTTSSFIFNTSVGIRYNL